MDPDALAGQWALALPVLRALSHPGAWDAGGWTGAACTAVVLSAWVRLRAPGTDPGLHPLAPALLAVAAVLGPLARVDPGGAAPWFWRSLYRQPTRAPFDDRTGAAALLDEAAGGAVPAPWTALALVDLGLEALTLLRRPSIPDDDDTDDGSAAARLLARALLDTDGRFGALRARRWCLATDTPAVTWSGPSLADGVGAAVCEAAGEPLCLLDLLRTYPRPPRMPGVTHVAVALRAGGKPEALAAALQRAVALGAEHWALLVAALPPGVAAGLPVGADGALPDEWRSLA